MKTTNVPMTKLLNGFKAPTKFYKEVHQNIHSGVAAMQPGKLYKAKLLVADGYWDTLNTNYWKWMAGRCFAHMVSEGLFPVKFVQYKKAAPNIIYTCN